MYEDEEYFEEYDEDYIVVDDSQEFFQDEEYANGYLPANTNSYRQHIVRTSPNRYSGSIQQPQPQFQRVKRPVQTYNHGTDRYGNQIVTQEVCYVDDTYVETNYDELEDTPYRMEEVYEENFDSNPQQFVYQGPMSKPNQSRYDFQSRSARGRHGQYVHTLDVNNAYKQRSRPAQNFQRNLSPRRIQESNITQRNPSPRRMQESTRYIYTDEMQRRSASNGRQTIVIQEPKRSHSMPCVEQYIRQVNGMPQNVKVMTNAGSGRNLKKNSLGDIEKANGISTHGSLNNHRTEDRLSKRVPSRSPKLIVRRSVDGNTTVKQSKPLMRQDSMQEGSSLITKRVDNHKENHGSIGRPAKLKTRTKVMEEEVSSQNMKTSKSPNVKNSCREDTKKADNTQCMPVNLNGKATEEGMISKEEYDYLTTTTNEEIASSEESYDKSQQLIHQDQNPGTCNDLHNGEVIILEEKPYKMECTPIPNEMIDRKFDLKIKSNESNTSEGQSYIDCKDNFEEHDHRANTQEKNSTLENYIDHEEPLILEKANMDEYQTKKSCNEYNHDKPDQHNGNYQEEILNSKDQNSNSKLFSPEKEISKLKSEEAIVLEEKVRSLSYTFDNSDNASHEQVIVESPGKEEMPIFDHTEVIVLEEKVNNSVVINGTDEQVIKKSSKSGDTGGSYDMKSKTVCHTSEDIEIEKDTSLETNFIEENINNFKSEAQIKDAKFQGEKHVEDESKNVDVETGKSILQDDQITTELTCDTINLCKSPEEVKLLDQSIIVDVKEGKSPAVHDSIAMNESKDATKVQNQYEILNTKKQMETMINTQIDSKLNEDFHLMVNPDESINLTCTDALTQADVGVIEMNCENEINQGKEIEEENVNIDTEFFTNVEDSHSEYFVYKTKESIVQAMNIDTDLIDVNEEDYKTLDGVQEQDKTMIIDANIDYEIIEKEEVIQTEHDYDILNSKNKDESNETEMNDTELPTKVSKEVQNINEYSNLKTTGEFFDKKNTEDVKDISDLENLPLLKETEKPNVRIEGSAFNDFEELNCVKEIPLSEHTDNLEDKTMSNNYDKLKAELDKIVTESTSNDTVTIDNENTEHFEVANIQIEKTKDQSSSNDMDSIIDDIIDIASSGKSMMTDEWQELVKIKEMNYTGEATLVENVNVIVEELNNPTVTKDLLIRTSASSSLRELPEVLTESLLKEEKSENIDAVNDIVQNLVHTLDCHVSAHNNIVDSDKKAKDLCDDTQEILSPMNLDSESKIDLSISEVLEQDSSHCKIDLQKDNDSIYSISMDDSNSNSNIQHSANELLDKEIYIDHNTMVDNMVKALTTRIKVDQKKKNILSEDRELILLEKLSKFQNKLEEMVSELDKDIKDDEIKVLDKYVDKDEFYQIYNSEKNEFDQSEGENDSKGIVEYDKLLQINIANISSDIIEQAVCQTPLDEVPCHVNDVKNIETYKQDIVDIVAGVVDNVSDRYSESSNLNDIDTELHNNTDKIEDEKAEVQNERNNQNDGNDTVDVKVKDSLYSDMGEIVSTLNEQAMAHNSDIKETNITISENKCVQECDIVGDDNLKSENNEFYSTDISMHDKALADKGVNEILSDLSNAVEDTSKTEIIECMNSNVDKVIPKIDESVSIDRNGQNTERVDKGVTKIVSVSDLLDVVEDTTDRENSDINNGILARNVTNTQDYAENDQSAKELVSIEISSLDDETLDLGTEMDASTDCELLAKKESLGIAEQNERNESDLSGVEKRCLDVILQSRRISEITRIIEAESEADFKTMADALVGELRDIRNQSMTSDINPDAQESTKESQEVPTLKIDVPEISIETIEDTSAIKESNPASTKVEIDVCIDEKQDKEVPEPTPEPAQNLLTVEETPRRKRSISKERQKEMIRESFERRKSSQELDPRKESCVIS